MFNNNDMYSNFMDAVNVLSFILQLMNSEEIQINNLREEVVQRLDAQTEFLLKQINSKLDIIINKLDEINGRLV